MTVARARRQPRKLGEALPSAVEPMAPATLLGAVQSAWAGDVGERVAAEASPISERDGVVTVACRSSAWAQELDLLAGEVVSALRSGMPAGTELRALRFTAAEPPA